MLCVVKDDLLEEIKIKKLFEVLMVKLNEKMEFSFRDVGGFYVEFIKLLCYFFSVDEV